MSYLAADAIPHVNECEGYVRDKKYSPEVKRWFPNW